MLCARLIRHELMSLVLRFDDNHNHAAPDLTLSMLVTAC